MCAHAVNHCSVFSLRIFPLIVDNASLPPWPCRGRRATPRAPRPGGGRRSSTAASRRSRSSTWPRRCRCAKETGAQATLARCQHGAVACSNLACSQYALERISSFEGGGCCTSCSEAAGGRSQSTARNHDATSSGCGHPAASPCGSRSGRRATATAHDRSGESTCTNSGNDGGGAASTAGRATTKPHAGGNPRRVSGQLWRLHLSTRIERRARG